MPAGTVHGVVGVSWHTVSSIAMRAVADLIAAAGADRLAGVRVIGVDEHRGAPRRVGAALTATVDRVRHAAPQEPSATTEEQP